MPEHVKSKRSLAIVKDASSFSIATILTQFISIISAILMRRFLGPVQVGVWALVQVLLTYAEYSNLGASSAITREIPFYQGRGDAVKVESLKNTVFYFSIVTSLIVSAAVLMYALLRQNVLSQDLFWGLAISSGLVILQRLNSLLISLLRAFKQFSLASRQMILSALVNAVLVAALSFRFRLYGFMAAMALSFLFNILYIFWRSRLSFRYSMNPGEIRNLVAYGFPLMLLALFGTLFETIDKIMITRFMGLEALGLYSIALMTSAYLYSLPNAVGIVMIPNIHEKFGQNGIKADLREFLEKSDQVFTVIMPIFIALAWFIVPKIVEMILPNFAGGISAVRWLSLGVFFLAIGQAYAQCIYVFRQHNAFFPIFIFSCSIAVLLNWIAIKKGYGINGVAVATSLTTYVHFTVLYFFAAPQIRGSGCFLKEYIKILGFFILMLFILLAASFLRLPNPYLTGLVQVGSVFVVYLPFLFHLNKRLGLMSALFGRFLSVGRS